MTEQIDITSNLDVLRKISEEVNNDENVDELIQKMTFALTQAGGIGLAAIQLEVPKRVIVYVERDMVDPTSWYVRHMINPKIVDKKGSIIKMEGCLSFPGQMFTKKRATEVTVDFTQDGKSLVQTFDGLVAIILQHEIDHTNGIPCCDDQYTPIKIGRNDPCPECLKEGIQIKYKKCKKHYGGIQ